MSLKIYSGCLVRGHNLSSFLAELKVLSHAFEEAAGHLAMKWLVRHATQLFDRAQLGLDETGPDSPTGPVSPLSQAWQALAHRQDQIQRTGGRDSAVDFSAELTVIPVGRRLLVIPYIEHPKLQELWQAQPWLEEFGFWDNSDRPDHVTATQWRRRKEAWNLALEPSFIPAKAGYTFPLLPVDGRVLSQASDEELETLLPDTRERARSLGLDLYLKQNPQPVLAGEGLYESVRRLRELETSEAYLAFKAKLEGQLPKLTVRQLQMAPHSA